MIKDAIVCLLLPMPRQVMFFCGFPVHPCRLYACGKRGFSECLRVRTAIIPSYPNQPARRRLIHKMWHTLGTHESVKIQQTRTLFRSDSQSEQAERGSKGIHQGIVTSVVSFLIGHAHVTMVEVMERCPSARWTFARLTSRRTVCGQGML